MKTVIHAVIIQAIWLLTPHTALANETAMSVIASSTGEWEGELYYLDYQSGERFSIPMRVVAEMTPDNATLVRKLTFTDPANLVYAVNTVTVEQDSGDLVESYFRDRQGQLLRYQIVDAAFSGEKNWQIVYEQDGIDDGRPARIRQTVKRDGDRISSRKEVRFLDADEEYFLRNGNELRLADEGR